MAIACSIFYQCATIRKIAFDVYFNDFAQTHALNVQKFHAQKIERNAYLKYYN